MYILFCFASAVIGYSSLSYSHQLPNNITCPSYGPFSCKKVTPILQYLDKFVTSWMPEKPRAVSLLFGNLP